MDDSFAILGVPRNLLLRDEELRSAYDTLSRERHPDTGGDPAAFGLLTDAYRTLGTPAGRLRHWLVLEAGEFEPRGEAPGEVMDLFGDLSGLLERLGAMRERKAAARSSLAKSLVERESVRALGEVESLRERLARLREAYEARFPEFEKTGALNCRREAGTIARGLAFLEKWEGELREASFAVIGGS